jgi:hypothetical protein
MAEPITAAVRLVVTPDPNKPGKFTARLDGTGEVVVHSSRQPLADAARELLLARGFDPVTPLTMRHEGSPHDSFRPLPIGKWAGWTYEERERDGIRCARWMPRRLHAERQKSGSEPRMPPKAHISEIRSYGEPAQHQGRAA